MDKNNHKRVKVKGEESIFQYNESVTSMCCTHTRTHIHNFCRLDGQLCNTMADESFKATRPEFKGKMIKGNTFKESRLNQNQSTQTDIKIHNNKINI